jgi:hypothetical protein
VIEVTKSTLKLAAAGAPDNAEQPLAERSTLGWAQLETPALTAAFWLAVAAFAVAFWVTPLPPCIDYPQHLALGAIVGRLLDPGSPERQLYEFTPLTYNGLFHVAVALLCWVVKPEIAGKLLLCCTTVLTGAAGLALARVGQRPRWYAFFLLPLCYGHITGWGFINYCLAAPLALLVFTWWLRWRDGEHRIWPRIVVGALLVTYAHVLATACLCVSVALAFFCSRWPREVGWRAWLRGMARAPLPVLPAALFAVIAFLYHRTAPHIFWEPVKDGTDNAAWEKLWYLSSFSVSNFCDPSDQLLFWVMLALVIVLLLAPLVTAPPPGSAPRRELAALAVAWFGLYLVVPRVLMSTHYIFERLPIWWLAFTLSSAPVTGPALGAALRPLVSGVGVLCGLNTIYHFARIPDARDASAIIDDIPEHGRVVAVMHSSDAYPVIWRRIWVHLAAYHTVRRSGELAFSFTRYASLPVRYQPYQTRPMYASGLEWNPQLFQPDAPYVAYFNTVLVKTPDDAPYVDPRELTFGYYAPQVRLLSQRGRFYLFDASGIFASAASGPD